MAKAYEEFWTTQKGDELLIIDMSTSHIENCIRYLERKLASGNTTQIIGQVPDWGEPDSGWWDEIDLTEDIKNYIRSFKHELKLRMKAEALKVY